LTPEKDGRFAADGTGVVRRVATPPAEPLRLYVSPFTSKYDPSPIYWSRLLCAVLADAPAELAIHCTLDAGPNDTTRRFAQEIVRSVAARAPAQIGLSVAEAADPEMPGLLAALSWMAAAHVVLCADSFTAHAAPLFGCLTCVIAASGLANWRVPHRASFYFNADDDLAGNAAAVRSLIRDYRGLGADTTDRPALTAVEQRLIHATAQLAALFAEWQRGGTADPARVRSQYQEFVDAYAELPARLEAWPPELGALPRDLDYHSLIQPLAPRVSLGGQHADDVLRHLYDRWWQWEHSNVRKYLALLAEMDAAKDASTGARVGATAG
jgi:hypothetical protein